MNQPENHKAGPLRRTSLAIGLALCLFGTGAMAQSTTGSIYGQAQAGDTVLVKSDSGVTRQVTVDAAGRYVFDSLPLGS